MTVDQEHVSNALVSSKLLVTHVPLPDKVARALYRDASWRNLIARNHTCHQAIRDMITPEECGRIPYITYDRGLAAHNPATLDLFLRIEQRHGRLTGTALSGSTLSEPDQARFVKQALKGPARPAIPNARWIALQTKLAAIRKHVRAHPERTSQYMRTVVNAYLDTGMVDTLVAKLRNIHPSSDTPGGWQTGPVTGGDHIADTPIFEWVEDQHLWCIEEQNDRCWVPYHQLGRILQETLGDSPHQWQTFLGLFDACVDPTVTFRQLTDLARQINRTRPHLTGQPLTDLVNA